MATENLIEASVFCTYHEIEYSFISELEEHGLIHLSLVNEQRFIAGDQLQQLEKMVRLHHDLDINIAGIEVVVNMLQRMEELQRQNTNLKNKLSLYRQY
ncbi:chaperone modulator CbpM [Mucilaginibacter jinjuensis]|uniref:Chaperone modulator CbpM n=1 Tax=Mucilaginibacter jinjuensis TaxID=1176721 RepID=A0ABY7TFY1_9SPHI|nr:chaperone modulator CbpM [Mucilaginibacter jinjuensis]WCT14062.1 chaperone modulator CbpM [Mucilaginibacter jinjuensis]